MKKLFAFTLAETLIVMGIIGIVSALTLPNLNSSTGEKEKVVKVKKLYQNFDDALGRAQAVYGPFDEWSNNTTRIGERITEFMKVTKTCGYGNATGCFSTPVKESNENYSEVTGSSGSQKYFFVLADGTSVALGSNKIIVDIDGMNKGPSATATDVFSFDISDKGEVKPTGEMNFSGGSLLTCRCFVEHGVECTIWVVENENLDYLKCPFELKSNKTSCK